MPALPEPSIVRLSTALSEQRDSALEQLTAAWQLQVSRIEEQLQAGWREQIERIFEDRFAELAARVEEEFRREIVRQADGAGRRATEQLNRALRRLRSHEDRGTWASALLDGTEGLSRRAILFSVEGRTLRGMDARGFENREALSGAEIPLDDAPAFATAIETREPVVAAVCAAELSAAVAAAAGETEGARGCLFPVIARDRAAAILYCDEDGIDRNGIEALATAAGAALEARPEPRPAETAEWAELSEADRQIHLRAQRFARVRVAEMRLYKPRNVRDGRAHRRLYTEFGQEIDTGRETFQREFLAGCPTMIDYFHQELVRTLAHDDPAMLGQDYPGPLV
jgi:hypothetical protein